MKKEKLLLTADCQLINAESMTEIDNDHYHSDDCFRRKLAMVVEFRGWKFDELLEHLSIKYY